MTARTKPVPIPNMREPIMTVRTTMEPTTARTMQTVIRTIRMETMTTETTTEVITINNPNVRFLIRQGKIPLPYQIKLKNTCFSDKYKYFFEIQK